jgi:hypothetical protein
MNYVLTAIVIVIVSMIAWYCVLAGQDKTTFNEWSKECRDQKGFVTILDTQLFSVQYECLNFEGEVIQLDVGSEAGRL